MEMDSIHFYSNIFFFLLSCQKHRKNTDSQKIYEKFNAYAGNNDCERQKNRIQMLPTSIFMKTHKLKCNTLH